MQCQNNLKQLGIALQLFHDTQRSFPASGWTMAGPGNPKGKYVGWRPMVLPYLEQENVYRLYDNSLNWWEGTNLAVASIPLPDFRCPSTPQAPEVLRAIAKPPRPAIQFSTPLAPTDYEAMQGVNLTSINPQRYNSVNRFSVMYRNSLTRIADIRDGTSTTVVVVECAGRPEVYRAGVKRIDSSNDQGIGWADSEGPFSLDGADGAGAREGCTPAAGCTKAINARNDNEPYSFHVSGAQVLFVDGHVSFISEDIPLDILAALCTRAAGEVVDMTALD
jgi:prepilin-type processing-associated H-X9-DG protein